MAGPEPKLVLSVAALTDTGRARGHNEDYVAYHVPPDPQTLQTEGALFLVCDGVGGGSAGEVASEHAARRILSDYFQPGNGSGPHAKLVAAIQRANSEIYSENARSRDDRKMATTVVAALVIGDQLNLAHAGDSRAYLVREGHISQLTRDHSWVAEMVEAGDLTEAEAQNHPWRNRITRSLGVAETVKLDTQSLALRAGDAIVLCTDGLTRHVSDAEIGTAASQNPPATAAEQLIQLANSRGGSDNITALVVRLQVEDLAPTERVPLPSERVLTPSSSPMGAPAGLAMAGAQAAPPPVAPARRGSWGLYAVVGGVALLALLAVTAVMATRWLGKGPSTATQQPADTAAVTPPETPAPAAGVTVAPQTTPAPDTPAAATTAAPELLPSGTAEALASLLAEATAAAVSPVAPLATAASQVQGSVIVGVGVRLRAGPSVSSEVVAMLEMGTSFFVIGWSQQEEGQCVSGIWLDAVLEDGTKGWICGDSSIVRVMGRLVSREYLEQLGVPTSSPAESALPTNTLSPTQEPRPTATRAFTKGTVPSLFAPFPIALPTWRFGPPSLPELDLAHTLPAVCVDLGHSPLNLWAVELQPLVLMPLPTVSLGDSMACMNGFGVCSPPSGPP